MRRWMAVVLLGALAAGGCTDSKEAAPSGGESVSADGSASAGGSADAGKDDDDGHGHTEPTLVDPATGKQGRIKETDQYTASSPPPVDFRPADVSGASGDVPLAASVAPGCVEHGQEVTFTFKSEAGVTVAAQVKWPNDQFSGLDSTRSTTAADGTLVWKLQVKPTALYGMADLQAAAIDERPEGRSRKGSFGNWNFVVAPPGRC